MRNVSISQELADTLVSILGALPADTTVPASSGVNPPDEVQASLTAEKALRSLRDAIEASQEGPDLGPWGYGATEDKNRRRVFLESEDFNHDVRLYLDGNFGSLEAQLVYVNSMAQLLNSMAKTLTRVKRDKQFLTLSKSADAVTQPVLGA